VLADTPIYRNDKQLGEHFVIFSPEVISEIRKKFFLRGYNTNTNVQHEHSVAGATLVDSYIVNSKDPKFPNVPEALAKQGVTDGSWIGTYYISNEQLWQDIKKGIFTGFSVEGFFDKKIQTNKTKMSKPTRNIFELIFGKTENFKEATSVDGVTVFYEGDLAVGTILQVNQEGTKVLAPSGAMQIEVDGITYAVEVDDTGAVTSLEEVVELSADVAQVVEAMARVVKDSTEAMAALKADYEAKFATLENKFAALQTDKFSPTPKSTSEAVSFKNLLKK
jgi:hypothetical protein